jgi:hypothetical protein
MRTATDILKELAEGSDNIVLPATHTANTRNFLNLPELIAYGNGLHEQEAEGGVVSEGKQEDEDEAMGEGA